MNEILFIYAPFLSVIIWILLGILFYIMYRNNSSTIWSEVKYNYSKIQLITLVICCSMLSLTPAVYSLICYNRLLGLELLDTLDINVIYIFLSSIYWTILLYLFVFYWALYWLYASYTNRFTKIINIIIFLYAFLWTPSVLWLVYIFNHINNI